jgi:hypothetical protein
MRYDSGGLDFSLRYYSTCFGGIYGIILPEGVNMNTPEFGNDAISHAVFYKMRDYVNSVESWQEDLEELLASVEEVKADITSRSISVQEMRVFLIDRGYDV